MPDIVPSTPDQVAVELARRFDDFGIDYAIGGALAMGLWSEPRATLDVDLTLFLNPADAGQVVKVLETLGCLGDFDQVKASLNELGYCRVSWRDCFVDVFLPTSEFLWQAKHRRTTVRFGGHDLRFWNAEVMAVLKLMFFRPKDLVDLKRLVEAQGPNLDHNWIRQKIIEVFGEHDPRTSTWNELITTINP
jgi:hypothetical protein